MAEERKRCPHCAEEILAAANKCKHCGEWLDRPRKVLSQADGTDSARAISYGIKKKQQSDAIVKVKLFFLVLVLAGITFVVNSVFLSMGGAHETLKVWTDRRTFEGEVLAFIWVVGLVVGGFKIAWDYYKE